MITKFCKVQLSLVKIKVSIKLLITRILLYGGFRKILNVRVCKFGTIIRKMVPNLHMSSIYAMLYEFPEAKQIAFVHLTKLLNLLEIVSRGQLGKDIAILFRDVARVLIRTLMSAKSLELKHTIKLIGELDTGIEAEIKAIMDKINTPILSIPGISYCMGAMIIAEIGDFNRFDSPDKILVYAGFSLSTY